MDALSYKGRSLSTGDVVVFQQRDKQAAYYVDAGAGYREVPEFFNPQEKQLTPDASLTGERIQTPRGSFYVTAMSREQIEAAGYGFHHQSEDGKYLIMGNGTQAYAIPAQQESHIKTAEMSTEQNYNMIDGTLNNAPSMGELEARANALDAHTFLSIVQKQAVPVTVIAALMRQLPGLAVLPVIHSRYAHSSCVLS